MDIHAQHHYLQQQIDALATVLPIQAPLPDFVHFNPLMHYEQLPFATALKQVYQRTGALGYLSQNEYKRFYEQGRITDDDLQAVLSTETDLSANKGLVAGWTTRELSQLMLLHPIKKLSYRQVRWKIEEEQALEQFQTEVSQQSQQRLLKSAGLDVSQTHQALNDLWQATLDILDVHEDFTHPEAVTYLSVSNLSHLWQEIKEIAHLDEADMEQQVQHAGHERLQRLINQVGSVTTLRGFLKSLTGEDVLHELCPLLFRQLGQWLDLELSGLTEKPQSFLSYWKQLALNDHFPGFSELDPWHDYIISLDDNPLVIIRTELMRIGIARENWGAYLRSLALEIPGWSGMVNWRAQHPNYGEQTNSIVMADYLAVRLVLEHLHCRKVTREHWNIEASLPELRGYFNHNLSELLVRFYAWQARLPEHLQMLASGVLNGIGDEVSSTEWHQLAHMIMTWKLAAGTTLPVRMDMYQVVWRMFVLSQYLGLSAQQLSQVTREQIGHVGLLMQALDDPTRRGHLWLRAYERHYRLQVFNALMSPLQLNLPKKTLAHILFCMDDREEAMRRHLEEIEPRFVTVGVAGVFGLPNNWRSFNNPKTLKLAQPVVTAVHEFREVPDVNEASAAIENYRKKMSWLAWIKLFKSHALRQDGLKTFFSLPLMSSFALSELIGRNLAAGRYQQFTQKLSQQVLKPVQLRVQYTAPESKAINPASMQLGLSLAEKIEKIAAFIKAAGFTQDFSRLVCLLAHRAQHLNNPHLLAYGCGACSGRFGGPNARAFVGSINDPEVRTALALRHQIHIPPECWFVAAEHDTTSDEISWFDTDLIPASHQAEFAYLQAQLTKASQAFAHERCRKFATAPLTLTPAQAFQHVQARAASPDQARAELGHQGCAVAFIAKRSMSQQRFWDRRSFLISYDYAQDPEGHLLEGQLLGNGVVGVGIALDYYFSRIQNGYLGSGSKVLHNLVGGFGVMEGTASDLRTGLAQQMTELHEPMRLLVVVEALVETVSAIYQRQAYLRQLLDNEWLQLAVKDPKTNLLYEFIPHKGLIKWEDIPLPLPVTHSSLDWYFGKRDYLPPARIMSVAA
ncbi:putative inorganic carbon transporter subunit DabA [uncultured Thiothrix sp.]|uniref:putative inorganic carbon transporter subunit DabA n=1 Tax=uncultured Thiothrix sp. TaxID=223185 RepID=UPI002639D17F|nr:putative inorganic carbon transporter subunit DabA [uncultured Thiothrix sp.]HMT92409.1 Na-translocating system protein MpsB [Thiolinea sp.]